MTYSTKLSTELKHPLQQIQRHFCQLEEAFSALNPSFTGEAGTRNCSFQDRAVLRKCTQSHSFNVIQVRVISEVAVIPVWWPVVTVLAAETRPTPEMPIIEVLTTTQFNSNTANSEVLRLGGDTSTLLPPLQHKPSPSSRVRAGQQGKKPLGKNWVFSASNTCLRFSPSQWIQACLLPGLWIGTVVRGSFVDQFHQKSPAQIQASCWYCHRPY